MHIPFFLLAVAVSIAFSKEIKVTVRGKNENGTVATVPYTIDTDKIKANDNTILDEICAKLDKSAKWYTHCLDAQRPGETGTHAFNIRNSGILTNLGDDWTILVVKRAKPLSQGK